MRCFLFIAIFISFCNRLYSQVVNDSQDRGDTYILIQSKWAGLSDDTNCFADIKTQEFDKLLLSNIQNNLSAFKYYFKPSAMHSMDIFLSYHRRLEYGVLTRKIAILPFFVCDKDLLTLNIYVYNFAKGQLTNACSLDISSSSLDQASKQVIEWISKNANQEAQTFISPSVFNACIYKYQLDYLYKLFKYDKEYIENLDYERSRNTYDLTEIKKGLSNYLSTLNYNYCDELRSDLEKEIPNRFTHKLERYEKMYPNLIKLITHIDLYEDYQIRNYIDREQMRNTLLLSKQKLIEQSEEVIPPKEAKRYHTKFRHNQIINRLGRATELLSNCEEIFQKAQQLEDQGDLLEASSIYLEILHNQDINKYFHEIKSSNDKEEDLICSSLKEYSWIGLDRIRRKLRHQYLNLLKQGDSFFNAQQYDQAFLTFIRADSLNQGLSYYAQAKTEVCKIKLNTERKLDHLWHVKQDINSILGRKFNYPDPNIASGNTRTFQVDEDRITLILENDTLNNYSSNSLYISRDYTEEGIVPHYSSGTIDDHLVEGLVEIYSKYPEEIEQIQIDYHGLSDSPLSVQLKKEDIKAVFGKKILKDTVYSKLLNQSFIVSELFSNKGFRIINGYPSENLLIAYLRARYKRDLHKRKYSKFIPDSILSLNILPEVVRAKGGQYRGVKTEIIIKLVDPVTSLPTKLESIPIETNLLSNIQQASDNALEELDQQELLVDSFNPLCSPYETFIVQESEHVDGEKVFVFFNDRDGDGIIDNHDLCPTRFGKWIHQGCPPDLDTDKDGIVDYQDKCPKQYGSKLTKGCAKMSPLEIFRQDRYPFFESRDGVLDISYSIQDYAVNNILKNVIKEPSPDQDSIIYITNSVNSISDTTGLVQRKYLNPQINDPKESHFLGVSYLVDGGGLAFVYKNVEADKFEEHSIYVNIALGPSFAKHRVQLYLMFGGGYTWGTIKDEFVKPYQNPAAIGVSAIKYSTIQYNARLHLKVFLTRSLYTECVYDYSNYEDYGIKDTNARFRLQVGMQL